MPGRNWGDTGGPSSPPGPSSVPPPPQQASKLTFGLLLQKRCFLLEFTSGALICRVLEVS